MSCRPAHKTSCLTRPCHIMAEQSRTRTTAHIMVQQSTCHFITSDKITSHRTIPYHIISYHSISHRTIYHIMTYPLYHTYHTNHAIPTMPHQPTTPYLRLHSITKHSMSCHIVASRNLSSHLISHKHIIRPHHQIIRSSYHIIAYQIIISSSSHIT